MQNYFFFLYEQEFLKKNISETKNFYQTIDF